MFNKLFVRYGTYLLMIVLVADAVFSFYLFDCTVLDGDMASVIGPSPKYRQVLSDPLGLEVLLSDKHYDAPNRFSSHWSMYTYFRAVPLWLQSFATPLNSIYLACAIVKIIVHLLLIGLLSLYITVDRKSFKNFLLAAVLITPLFQTFGFNAYMGIVDLSITYVFFYGLGMALFLLFMFPFYKSLYTEEKIKINIFTAVLLLFIVFYLSFVGSITPGVVLVVCPFTLLFLWYSSFHKNDSLPFLNRAIRSVGSIPLPFLIYYVLFTLLCCYSYYIGLNNTESADELVSLKQRFLLLPQGLLVILFKNKGFPVLLFFIVLNVFILYKNEHVKREKLFTILKFILLISLLYVLLLPFGGYRPYRPLIVRYDTFLPVTLGLVYFFGLSTFTILSSLQFKLKNMYLVGLSFLLIFYTLMEFRWQVRNDSERAALQTIARSKDSIVLINDKRPLLTWNIVSDYHDSEVPAQLLLYWGITKEKKYYYQKK